MPFTITSPAIRDGETIPSRFTCEGEDVSPPLAWSEAPPETRSFVLIVDDPDAPNGTFTHWVLYDIGGSATRLPEAVEPGQHGRTLINDFGRARYNGPCPPRGHGVHRYRFTLYALDVPVVRMRGEAGRRDVEEAMRSHVLAYVTLTGLYQRT